MRTAIIEISLFVAAFILGWIKTGWPALFYIALGLTLVYAIGMAAYLIVRFSKLSWGDRSLGAFALGGWLVVAWAIMHAKGFIF